MQAVLLKSRTSKWQNVVYLTAGIFSGCAAVYAASRSSWAAILAAAFGGLIFWAWRSEQGQRQLGIDHYGLTIQASRSQVTIVPWAEIETIAVVDVGADGGRGIYSYRGQYVVVSLASHSNLRFSKTCSDNRNLCAYDILLSNFDGTPLKNLEALLLKAKERARHG